MTMVMAVMEVVETTAAVGVVVMKELPSLETMAAMGVVVMKELPSLETTAEVGVVEMEELAPRAFVRFAGGCGSPKQHPKPPAARAPLPQHFAHLAPYSI
eukprot:Hpha_TRINITY_DN15373_c2_g1::TRINITY_DN15373_c2_g1_i1::g.87621::m.87621